MGHIFWDFDGTLVQSSPLWRRAMLEALDLVHPGHAVDLAMLAPLVSTGFPWHTHHDHDITSSELWWRSMEKKFAGDFQALGFSQETAIRAAALIRPRILDPKAYKEFEEVRGVLERLNARGWQHVVLSNNHPDLDEVIKALGLASYFTDVISSGAVGFEKPRAEIFEYALQRTGARLEQCWMVGDNPVADVQGAESVGLRAILVRSAAAASRKAQDLVGVEEIINGGS